MKIKDSVNLYITILCFLQKAGFHIFANIVNIVASLMGMREEEISDQWTEIYFSFLDQAHCYKISEMAEDLKPLAEECYNTLLACKNIEDRTSHRVEI